MSGIYIHGIKMPKDGYIDVRLFSDGWAHIPTDEPPYYSKAFEAIELPPHGRFSIYDGVIVQNDAEPTIIPADPEGGENNG